MEKSDVVIIGGVACGPKTAAVLARRKPDLKISLFQREKYISYGTCGLPYFASGDINSFEELAQTSYGTPRDVEFFKKTKGFDVITESEVIEIDRRARSIKIKNLKSGEIIEHSYDKLVIATGANPTVPPFPVDKSDRIKPFTRPDDAINFRKLAQTGQIESAVVIGGGFIGCEVAEAAGGLWGIDVTLLEREPQLLPYVLDPEISNAVERELRRQNVKVLTGCAVQGVAISDEGIPVVKAKGRENIKADYVFLCLGVTPETSLAGRCGLELGATGAIKVNEYLQTSDPDIYAGGDCIENISQLTGESIYMPMGSLANRHGRVIAENLAGNKTKFPGVIGSFLVKVFDLNVGAVGLSQTAAGKIGIETRAIWGSFPDKPDYYPEYKTFVLKLVYDDCDRLLGLQAAGPGDICRRVDVYSAFLRHKGSLQDLLDFEPGYAPPYSEALDPLHQLAAAALAQNQGLSFISPDPVGLMRVRGDCFWLDVREPDEFENDALPLVTDQEPVNIPLNDLRARLSELPKNKRIMIICKRGPRSYQSALILKQAGFDNVHIIGGGVTALK